MSDFRTGRKKDLDFVVATRGTAEPRRKRSLAALASHYSLSLTMPTQLRWLDCLACSKDLWEPCGSPSKKEHVALRLPNV